jgi:hypothetical protein
MIDSRNRLKLEDDRVPSNTNVPHAELKFPFAAFFYGGVIMLMWISLLTVLFYLLSIGEDRSDLKGMIYYSSSILVYISSAWFLHTKVFD